MMAVVLAPSSSPHGRDVAVGLGEFVGVDDPPARTGPLSIRQSSKCKRPAERQAVGNFAKRYSSLMVCFFFEFDPGSESLEASTPPPPGLVRSPHSFGGGRKIPSEVLLMLLLVY